MQVSVNVPDKPILLGTDTAVNVKTVGCMVGVHREGEGALCVGDCTTPPFCELVFDEDAVHEPEIGAQSYLSHTLAVHLIPSWSTYL